MAPAGLWRPRRTRSLSRARNPSRVRGPHTSTLARKPRFLPHFVLTQGHVRCILRCLLGAFLLIGATVLCIDRGGSVKAFVGKTAENAKAKLPLYTWAIGTQTSSPNPAAPWKNWKEPCWLPSAADGTDVSEEAAYLNYLVYRYGLTPDVPWYARRVRADYVGAHDGNPKDAEDDSNLLQHHPRQIRPSLTKVKSKLTPGGFTTVRAEASVPGIGQPDAETEDGVWSVTDAESEPPIEPAVLRLAMARSARPDQIDASALLFGVSTTYARLAHAGFALPADWARWLTDGRGRSNGAGLLLSLHRAQPDEAEAVLRVLQRHGIDARVVVDPGNFDGAATNSTSEGHNDMEGNIRPDPPAVRYSNLLPLLQQYGDNWAVEEEEEVTGAAAGNARHVRDVRDASRSKKDGGSGGSGAKTVPRTGAGAAPVQRSFHALIDDDVFFPSMDRLLGRLMQYAGTHPQHPHGGGDSSNDVWLGFPSMRSDWSTVDFAAEAAAAAAVRSDLFSPPPPPPRAPQEPPPPSNLSPSTTTTTTTTTSTSTSSMVVSYGGGAVFVSPSLAVRMAALPCLRRTTDALHEAVLHAGIAVGKADAHDGEPWDEHLYRCATSSSASSPAVQLRIVPSFYAPFDTVAYDHNGNETDPENGVRLLQQYAGGLQPLTLHGYRRQYHFNAGFGHRVADVCGEDCFLQRFAFRDGWVLVNGHSLEHHDGGLRVEPLRKASISTPPPVIDSSIGHGSTDIVDSLRSWLGSGSGSGAVPKGRGASSDRSHSHEDAAGRRRREYQQQQHFWSGKQLVVEDAERPRDVSVVRSRSRRAPATWELMDAYVAADGSLWQAYVKRRAASRHGPDDAADTSDAASSDAPGLTVDRDQDSVIVLMWENKDR